MKKHPTISVVIPAYNEAARIKACLSSLQAQTYKDYEIIVVDNNSTDRTAELARTVPGVRVISESRQGVCAAREAGRAAARGDIIVSTDADCTFKPTWLTAIAEFFDRQPGSVLLIGTYRFANSPWWGNLLLSMWESLAMRAYYGFGKLWYVSAANLAYRREAFTGYDLRLTQGGDELYVLQELRKRGRVVMRRGHGVTTSSRRLQQGFLRLFFNDFLRRYLLAFWRSRRTGQTAVSFTAYRDEGRYGRIQMASSVMSTVFIVLVVSFLAGRFARPHVHLAHPLLFWSGYGLLSVSILSYCALWPRSQTFGPLAIRGYTTEKKIALTFDDGPNGAYTSDIAAILESYDGHGTFFQVGANITRQPDLTKKLHNQGHLIGLHSWSHRRRTNLIPNRLTHEVIRTRQLLQSLGIETDYVRTPWLFRTPGQMVGLTRQGLTTVGGRFVSICEPNQPQAKQMARNALKHARPGSILILHDGFDSIGADRHQTVEATRIICRELSRQGYQFVRVDELV